MKIAVFGVGGTGGVLGGYLAAAGNDVTFLARGKHLAAMEENGLCVHTKHRGDILIRPVQVTTAEAYTDTPDVLLVCVKYYNLEDAIALAKRVAGPDTLVVPVLNVFGTGGVMQKQLPQTTVLDGCMYVFARIGGPGVIEQPQKTLRCFFGFRPGQDQRLAPKARELEQRMQEAGIDAHFTDQIQRDALVKFSFVSPMGAAGLYLDAVSDDFQQPGEARDLFVGLVKEVIALGTAMGVTFDDDLLDRDLQLMDGSEKGMTTSMQRDVAGGGKSEFAGLVTRISDLGKEYGVPTPLYDKIAAWGRERGIR